MQRACSIFSSVACAALRYSSTLSHKGAIFEKKRVLNTKCVFLCSLQLLSKTFLILRKIERDMIKKLYIGLHVKYPLLLSDFNRTLIFLTDFRKILKYKIS